MATKKDSTDGLDLRDEAKCKAAVQTLLMSRQGFKAWFIKATRDCEKVLDRYSDPLYYGTTACFAPSFKLSVNHSTSEIKNWMDDASAYFSTFYAEILASLMKASN